MGKLGVRRAMFTWPVIIRGVWRQCHFLADVQPVTLKIDKDITNTVGTGIESNPVVKESDLILCSSKKGIIRKPLRLQIDQIASIIKSNYNDLENVKRLNIKSLWIFVISKMAAVFVVVVFLVPNELNQMIWNDMQMTSNDGTIFIFKGYTPISL